jgi:hypothetical protein
MAARSGQHRIAAAASVGLPGGDMNHLRSVMGRGEHGARTVAESVTQRADLAERPDLVTLAVQAIAAFSWQDARNDTGDLPELTRSLGAVKTTSTSFAQELVSRDSGCVTWRCCRRVA